MIESNVKNIMENMDITYAELESVTGLSSQIITCARSRRIREMSGNTGNYCSCAWSDGQRPV